MLLEKAPNLIRSLLKLFTLASIALALACSEAATKKDDPAELFKEAEQEISNDHYMLAIDKLREVKNKFPYSKYAVEAQLRLGDVYFLQESFSEAASTYEAFRDLHPKHEKVSHALFRAGKSHFNETPDEVSRDLSAANQSLRVYAEFLRKFPSDPNANEARKDVATLEERLAEKTFRIAEFYFKRKQLLAAKARYAEIIEQYPQTLVAKTAKTRAAKCEENK